MIAKLRISLQKNLAFELRVRSGVNLFFRNVYYHLRLKTYLEALLKDIYKVQVFEIFMKSITV